jgi:uncharacterized protein (TIGR02569 family)
MKSVSLDDGTLAAFGCEGTYQSLIGGEGYSVRVNSCVLKLIENETRYSWACNLLLRLNPKDHRIYRPLRARTGSFVFNGWGASKYEPGDHINGRWDEKLQVCRSFHSLLNQLNYSSMPPSNDHWTQAHEIAWQSKSLPNSVEEQITEVIEELFVHYLPMRRSEGIIHSDICGNILFHDSKQPCVIDFSPAYGSAKYAEAIFVADAIAWERAPLEIVQQLPYSHEYRQLLLRAINFRLIVTALFWPNNVERFFNEVREFEAISGLVIKDG